MLRSPTSDRPTRWCIRRKSGSMNSPRWATISANCGMFAPLLPPAFDLISMLAHAEATRHLQAARIHRHDRAADRRRQRYHPQFHERRVDGVGRESRTVRTGAGAARIDSESGLRDHPLSHAGAAYAPHRARRRRTRRPPDRQGRQGGDVVHFRQSRRKQDRPRRTNSSSTAPSRGSISPSAPASTAASAIGSPSSKSASSGRKSCNRDLRFEIMGPPQRLYSNFIRGIRALPVRIVKLRSKPVIASEAKQSISPLANEETWIASSLRPSQ